MKYISEDIRSQSDPLPECKSILSVNQKRAYASSQLGHLWHISRLPCHKKPLAVFSSKYVQVNIPQPHVSLSISWITLYVNMNLLMLYLDTLIANGQVWSLFLSTTQPGKGPAHFTELESQQSQCCLSRGAKKNISKQDMHSKLPPSLVVSGISVSTRLQFLSYTVTYISMTLGFTYICYMESIPYYLRGSSDDKYVQVHDLQRFSLRFEVFWRKNKQEGSKWSLNVIITYYDIKVHLSYKYLLHMTFASGTKLVFLLLV